MSHKNKKIFNIETQCPLIGIFELFSSWYKGSILVPSLKLSLARLPQPITSKDPLLKTKARTYLGIKTKEKTHLKKPENTEPKTAKAIAFKMSKPAFAIVAMLLFSSICAGAPIAPVSYIALPRFSDRQFSKLPKTTATCAKEFDFIPSRYRDCSESIPVFCFTSVEVCYPLEGLNSILPCLAKVYYPTIWKRIGKCNFLAKTTFRKIGLACSKVTDLKAFYRCFNDGV